MFKYSMKKKMTEAEAESFIQKLSKFVNVGKYKEGLPIAKQALKQFPDDLVCQYQYAKLLGDWADELPLAKRKPLKKQAAGILAKLTRRLQGQPMERRFGISLNYYYQSAAFKDMYGFGKRFVKTNRQKGLYAQALGACLLAEQLYSKGKTARTQQWASKSVAAWKKYDLANEQYYFAHYSFAKALALQGDASAAFVRLKKAAKVSKRPLTDWEFADVLKMIEAAEPTSK